MIRSDDAPDFVITVDWSAASTAGPKRPSPDRCWLAWGHRSEHPTARPSPEYFRTRPECEARVRSLAESEGSSAIHVLIGFDFPIGYPLADNGSPVLPTGRGVCACLASLVNDRPDGTNNRFEVAAELNRQIRKQTGVEKGPFWGHPVGREYQDLTFRKTRGAGVREFRRVESDLRDGGRNIQSAWKLAGAGSVGSQSILGLPVVHRLLSRFQDTARLWPFEPPIAGSPDGTDSEMKAKTTTIAEIWPTLGDQETIDHPVKDARQVVAMRDAILDEPRVIATLKLRNALEGWILGVES